MSGWGDGEMGRWVEQNIGGYTAYSYLGQQDKEGKQGMNFMNECNHAGYVSASCKKGKDL